MNAELCEMGEEANRGREIPIRQYSLKPGEERDEGRLQCPKLRGAGRTIRMNRQDSKEPIDKGDKERQLRGG